MVLVRWLARPSPFAKGLGRTGPPPRKGYRGQVLRRQGYKDRPACGGFPPLPKPRRALGRGHRGMAAHPFDIRAAGVLDHGSAVFDGQAGSGRSPTVRLVVAVGKAENAGAVVVTARHVVPLVRRSHGGDQPAVVYGVRIFVGKNPELGRRGCGDVTFLCVGCEPRHPVLSGLSASFEEGVHRDAADPLWKSGGGLSRRQIPIPRTLINPGASGVGIEQPVGDKLGIGVVRRGSPIEDSVEPIGGLDGQASLIAGENLPTIEDAVVDQSPAVVVGVETPSQSQLPVIAGTRYGEATGLGFAQGWQQQSRQDRNDRDDHEQFNQSERATATRYARLHVG